IRALDPGVFVEIGAVVRIHLEPKRYSVDREDLRRRIVFENENFVVVDKPSGLPMHPTLDNLRENLLWAFENRYFLTHRLDVPTSGLVVLAKTKKYQSLFNTLISERKVRKLYEALTHKPVAEG